MIGRGSSQTSDPVHDDVGLLNVCQFKGYDLSQYIILVLPTWQDGLHTIGLKD